MPEPSIAKAAIFEDHGGTFLARVKSQSDTEYITQAKISSITCYVYKKGTSGDAIAEIPLTVSSVVSDSLVTDDHRWTADTTGYNFIYHVPGCVFSAGAITYRVEFVFIPTTNSDDANAAGTATGGGDDYILLADSGEQSDDAHNTKDIVLTGGTGSGQRKYVIDYDHTGHASGERYCQVDSNWTTTPDATTTYIIDSRPFPVAWDVQAKELRWA